MFIPAGILHRNHRWSNDAYTEHTQYPPGFAPKADRVPGYAITFTLSGAVRVGPRDGRHFIARAGDVVFIEPQPEPDHVWAVHNDPDRRPEPWDVYVSVFTPRPVWAHLLKHTSIMPGYARVSLTDPQTLAAVRRAFEEMYRFYLGSLSTRVEFQLNLIENVLLWCWGFEANRSAPLDPRIKEAVEYLSLHFSEKISLADLCRQSHLSRARLAALFHEQVGDSPMRFMEMCRLVRAAELLRLSDQKIDSIARTVGFCDAKHFANRFRQQMGFTPSHYRTEARLGRVPDPLPLLTDPGRKRSRKTEPTR